MKAWAYLRTSTDDKGQDPERQLDRIRPWLATNQGELAGYTVDEGTSGLKKGPFERKRFLYALEEAHNVGAKFLIVETGDRFTRQDPARYFVDAYRLQTEYGLRLLVADESFESQNSRLSPVITAIKAMAANEWIENHREKVKSGMKRKICKLPPGHFKGPDCNGAHWGKPVKKFSDDEIKLVWDSRHAKPRPGWRTIAHQINTARGCFALKDEERRRGLMVSSINVRRLYANLERVNPVGLLTHLEAKEADPA